MASVAHHFLTNPHFPVFARASSTGLADRLATTLRLWRKRSGERAALAGLSELELHDVGLTSADMRHEAGKPFWRA